MILYKFKGAASDLYSTDRTQEIKEHKKDCYSAWAFKENVKNSVLWA